MDTPPAHATDPSPVIDIGTGLRALSAKIRQFVVFANTHDSIIAAHIAWADELDTVLSTPAVGLREWVQHKPGCERHLGEFIVYPELAPWPSFTEAAAMANGQLATGRPDENKTRTSRRPTRCDCGLDAAIARLRETEQMTKEDDRPRVDRERRAASPTGSTAPSNEVAPTFDDGWLAGLKHARNVLGRHEWHGQREDILAVVDAVHEKEP